MIVGLNVVEEAMRLAGGIFRDTFLVVNASLCSWETLQMSARTSNNATALRRLMTEYKQLTAGGSHPLHTHTQLLTSHKAPPMACSQLVRPSHSPILHPIRPISRPRLRIRLFHLGSSNMWSQRHAIRAFHLHIRSPRHIEPSPLGRWRLCRQAHLCTLSSPPPST